MAIKKIISLPSGFDVEYWKISDFVINRITSKLNVKMYAYKNKAARDANKSNVFAKNFDFPFNEVEVSLTDIYNLLSALPYFEGCEAC
jgi:hypothetical protein